MDELGELAELRGERYDFRVRLGRKRLAPARDGSAGAVQLPAQRSGEVLVFGVGRALRVGAVRQRSQRLQALGGRDVFVIVDGDGVFFTHRFSSVCKPAVAAAGRPAYPN